jgi:hypothetical protein
VRKRGTSQEASPFPARSHPGAFYFGGDMPFRFTLHACLHFTLDALSSHLCYIFIYPRFADSPPGRYPSPILNVLRAASAGEGWAFKGSFFMGSVQSGEGRPEMNWVYPSQLRPVEAMPCGRAQPPFGKAAHSGACPAGRFTQGLTGRPQGMPLRSTQMKHTQMNFRATNTAGSIWLSRFKPHSWGAAL